MHDHARFPRQVWTTYLCYLHKPAHANAMSWWSVRVYNFFVREKRVQRRQERGTSSWKRAETGEQREEGNEIKPLQQLHCKNSIIKPPRQLWMLIMPPPAFSPTFPDFFFDISGRHKKDTKNLQFLTTFSSTSQKETTQTYLLFLRHHKKRRTDRPPRGNPQITFGYSLGKIFAELHTPTRYCIGMSWYV